MNQNNYNEYSGGWIDNWANRTERELIVMVAKKMELNEKDLKDKIAEEKKAKRYSKDLTYWQILTIATTLKYQLSKR